MILGVDRFLDMCRTTLNVAGDLVIAKLITSTVGQDALDAVGEQGAIGEAGEGVEVGLLLEAELLFDELGDVHGDAHDAVGAAAGRGKGVGGEAQPAQLAVGPGDLHQQWRGVAFAAQGAGHRKVVDRAGASGFGAAVAGQGCPVPAGAEGLRRGKLGVAGRVGVDQATRVIPQLKAFFEGHQNGADPLAHPLRVHAGKGIGAGHVAALLAVGDVTHDWVGK